MHAAGNQARPFGFTSMQAVACGGVFSVGQVRCNGGGRVLYLSARLSQQSTAVSEGVRPSCSRVLALNLPSGLAPCFRRPPGRNSTPQRSHRPGASPCGATATSGSWARERPRTGGRRRWSAAHSQTCQLGPSHVGTGTRHAPLQMAASSHGGMEAWTRRRHGGMGAWRPGSDGDDQAIHT